MKTLDPVWAGVAELSRAFETRALSPVDVVDALLARIARRDPALHAYIAIYESEARLAAEAADRAIKSGHRVGPLHGVPIGLKDLIDLRGRVTTGGSKVWVNRASPLSFRRAPPGLIAASVEAAALFFRVPSGPAPRDLPTLGWAPADPLPTLRRGVAGLRLATLPDDERVGVDAEVLAAYDASVKKLAGLGAEIVRVALPNRFSDYAAGTGRIIGAEGYRFVGHLVDDMSLPVDPHIRPRIQVGRGMSARDYLMALADREAHRRAFVAALADMDALLTPTTQTAAIPIAKVDQSGTAAVFTRAGN